MRPVRIFFEKRGRARFISHLDLNRCMARALRRAQIEVWFTQGFNPHPYITFALPLSLFYESACEVMDMRLEGEMPFEEARGRLAAQMPEGILVREAAAPVMKPTEIALATYEVTLDYPGVSSAALRRAVDAMLALPTLPVEKKTKRGQMEMDTLPYWKDAACEAKDGALFIRAVLPAGQQMTVNPAFFVQTLTRFAGLEPELDHVLRTGVFTAQMQPFR